MLDDRFRVGIAFIIIFLLLCAVFCDRVKAQVGLRLRYGSDLTVPLGDGSLPYLYVYGPTKEIIKIRSSLSDGPYITFSDINNVNRGFIGLGAVLVAGNDQTDLTIRSEDIIDFATNGANRAMRILANQNISIGNTTATQKLHVEGGIVVANGQAYYAKTSGANDGAIMWASGADQIRVGNDAYWSGIGFMPGTAIKMQLNSSGNLLLGSTVEPSANGGKVFVVGDNANDPTMGTNTAGFYGKDVSGTVEAFAVDEGSTASQLTTHDKDGNLMQFSFNNKENWAEYTDIYGLIEAVEGITGKKFQIKRRFKNPGDKRELLRAMLKKENERRGLVNKNKSLDD